MIFASTELAARIERADCRLLTDIAEAVTREQAERDVVVLPVGGGVAAFLGAGSPMTKVAGLGFGGAVPDDAWDEIERTWAKRGVAVQVELSCLADPSIARQLTRRGYELVGFENVLGRAMGARADVPPGATESEFEISLSGVDELSTWTDIAVTGFAAADTQGAPSHESFPREALRRAIADLVGGGGMSLFVASRGGERAAIASMRVCGGIAQMCGAATLPDHRRRGAHTALLRTRLEHAGQAGCDLATVVALPGSKSHQNVQQWGFELLYTRAMLVRGAE